MIEDTARMQKCVIFPPSGNAPRKKDLPASCFPVFFSGKTGEWITQGCAPYTPQRFQSGGWSPEKWRKTCKKWWKSAASASLFHHFCMFSSIIRVKIDWGSHKNHQKQEILKKNERKLIKIANCRLSRAWTCCGNQGGKPPKDTTDVRKDAMHSVFQALESGGWSSKKCYFSRSTLFH